LLLRSVADAPITALFLDVGGVLLTNGWDRRSRRAAAERFGLDYDAFDERHHLTFDAFESGQISLDEYLDRTVFHDARPFSREDFRAFMFDQSAPLAGMRELIGRLKAKHGLRVVAVSNEGRELTLYRAEKFGLMTLFDCYLASSFVHLRKPDPALFQMALDVAQRTPAESLYIDDRPLFVEVAADSGLRGLVHRSLEETRDALASFGLGDEEEP